MASKKLTISSLLILPLCLHAQTAPDYLHRGAQDYIFGYEDEAKTAFTEGVRRFPDDEPLRKALGLIREQKKSESSKPQPGEDGKKNQDQKDQKDQDQKAGEEGDKGEKKEGQQGKKDENSPQKAPGKDGKQEPQAGEKGEEKKAGESDPSPDKKLSGEIKANSSQPQDQKEGQEEAAAEELAEAKGEMTERQAKALLDSLKGEDDKVRLVDPSERKRGARALRDW